MTTLTALTVVAGGFGLVGGAVPAGLLDDESLLEDAVLEGLLEDTCDVAGTDDVAVTGVMTWAETGGTVTTAELVALLAAGDVASCPGDEEAPGWPALQAARRAAASRAATADPMGATRI